MNSRTLIRRTQYYDSVFLMGITKKLSESAGVRNVAVFMASENNKEFLVGAGADVALLRDAGPNDLAIAVTAETEAQLEIAFGDLDRLFAGTVQALRISNPHTLQEGMRRKPDANLAVISVPGEYAYREASLALERGLNVFLFSNNVSIDDEIRLKRKARERGLLVMGPDCGTSLLGGYGLGFANRVRRGPIGVVSASGTGLQEFASLVHRAGSGISHGIGTGGRDLSDRVGGSTLFAALDLLEADPGTKVVAILSKPPGAETLARLKSRLDAYRKPAAGCFLGMDLGLWESRVPLVSTLDEAADWALSSSGIPGERPEPTVMDLGKPKWNAGQKYIRGIFAGGTFCYQSQGILRQAGLSVVSNAPLDARNSLPAPGKSLGHALIDMGADEFTAGRPHPMMDGTMRSQRILEESEDPGMAILLVDFILGYNSSADPVGEVVDALRTARERASRRNGELVVAANLCGTEEDPQSLDAQRKALEGIGAVVFPSNALAASYCAQLITRHGGPHGTAGS